MSQHSPSSGVLVILMGASKPPVSQKPNGTKRHAQVGKLPSFMTSNFQLVWLFVFIFMRPILWVCFWCLG